MRRIFIFIFLSLYFTQIEGKLPKVIKGAPLPSNIFVELSKMINPLVVNISTTTILRQNPLSNYYDDPFSFFLKRYYGRVPIQKTQSLGSGFIIREDGLIITNSHVIDKASEITVTLHSDPTVYKAEIIGQDPRTDIALIKIKPNKKLKTAQLGDSSKAEVGEMIAVFGNPYGHNNTLTIGVISAINRHVNKLSRFNFIQTDASINPGNSGGPLVNLKGEVIGMSSMVLVGQSRIRAAQGIAFAIPSNRIKQVIKPLEEKGYIERGFIGLELTPWSAYISPQSFGLKKTKGALVGDVMVKSPAKKAGIKPYDVIIEFNGKEILGPDELVFLASETSVGQKVKVKVLRNKGRTEKTLTLTVGKLPSSYAKSPQKRKRKFDLSKIKKYDTGFGFKVIAYSNKIAQFLGIGALPHPRPIIIEVSPKLQMKLIKGDVILDVNQKPTPRPQNVKQSLVKGEVNFIRILRKGRVFIVNL